MLKSVKAWFVNHLTVKIALSILLLQLFTSAAFAFSGYYVNQNLIGKLLEQFDMRLQTDIQIAADMLSDLPGSDTELKGTDDPNYAVIKGELEKLQATHGLENIYILSKSQGEERILVLSGVPDDYGTPYPFTSEMNDAIANNKEMLSSIYTDEYGIHKSIFMPLQDANQESYGILGIDLDASVVPETSDSIFWTTFWITALVLVIGTLLAVVISKIITRPIRNLMIATEKVATGDLREQLSVSRKDELGKLADSFGEMGKNLQTLIRQIRQSSDQVSATSTQLLHSADETSRSAQQAAESTSQMSDGINDIVNSVANSTALINEIDSELTDVSEDMKEMRQIAQQVRTQSEDGQQLVEQTLHQMSVIKDVMSQSQEAALNLGERSKEIGGIINMISDISEQTNLLALNASIEAARVGEMGKGFAVVAGEVKKLAAQSAEAALSVRQLVSGTQENSKLVIDLVGEGRQAAEQGHSWISGTYENFNTIHSGVSRFSDRTDLLQKALEKVEQSFVSISASMQQISSVTQEQAAGTEEVASGAQQQSATMQEITGAIEQMNAMSVELQKSVQHFKL
ncbi:methyl-accepting chemotaxis protein [Cohnella lupini]|uniref:Methyl-accepting chemotaxis protein n=1 Tax=Cohnella lupini TaxID=1294267 RepID=A0A3D9HR35_9BACL|nr:methyl-accepting chemotaxis protein [Cohnella lupini]RED51938.1 methyl-accepting chemotaxis protein [Cohnella lupini]